jgi:hypothetical protein
MRNSILRITIFYIVIALNTATSAQLKVDAQFRTRSEFRDGYQKLAAKDATPAFLISQRSRFNISYETEDFKLRFSPQDVRIWGDEEIAGLGGVNGNKASIDMFEGYVDFRVSPNIWLAIGRQRLVYDNEYILAARNWNQRGISSDAILYKYSRADWKVHIAGSWNTLKESRSDVFYPTDRLKSLNLIWINKDAGNGISTSFLHVASGVTETDTTNTINFRQTSGFYTNIKKGDFAFQGNAYYQYGKNQQKKNVSAYLLVGDASVKAGNLTPGIGIAYLSGNNKIGEEQKTDNLFDYIYGGRHRNFGYIDYFRTFSTDTRQGGLADYYFYLDYKFNDKVSIRNIGHYFQLAQTNPLTPEDKNLGYENDIVVRYRFSPIGTLESGYSFVLPTDNLKELQGIQDAKFSQFFYLMLTFAPTIFKS